MFNFSAGCRLFYPLVPLFLFLFQSILLPGSSQAFISTRSTSGAVITWGRGAELRFRTNSTNSSGLSDQTIFDIFTTSLSRWKQAALSGFQFLYYQGTSTGSYPNYSGSARDNSIFFTSNAAASENLACGTVAITQIWFNAGNGQASKADLRFNDRCFLFTNNQADTVTMSRIYLGDVATHELGHALGFDHSQTLQSSMVFTAALQQSKLSCDDKNAALSLYAPGASVGNIAGLSGRVTAPSGQGIFGAFVEAISVERGTVMSGVLSDPDGTFHFSALESGHYRLLISPYYAGASSLSRYYDSINTAVCGMGGTNFSRTFSPTVYSVQGRDTNAGNVAVSCNGLSQSAPFLINGTVSPATLNEGVTSLAASASSGSTIFVRVAAPAGPLRAVVSAHSLYSPLDPSIQIVDERGALLPSQTTNPNRFANATSGYTNFDAEALVELSAAQTVYVKVSLQGPLPSTAYPSGRLGVDSQNFFHVGISSGDAALIMAQTNSLFAPNARCEAPDQFSAYPRQGDPGSVDSGASGSGSSDNAGGFGGCGQILPLGLYDGEGSDHNDASGSGGAPSGTTTAMVNMSLVLAMLALSRRGLAKGLGLRS